MKQSHTREKEVNERFAELRGWMQSVYTHWHVASVEEVGGLVANARHRRAS